jgi:hypothetical protein
VLLQRYSLGHGPWARGCLLLHCLQGDVVLQLSSLLSNYQQRNITTVFDNRYPVWKVRREFAVNIKNS